MPYCPNCGTPLADGAAACERCRRPLPAAQARPALALRSPRRGLILGSLSDAVLAIRTAPLPLLGFFFAFLAFKFLSSFSIGMTAKNGVGELFVTNGVSLVAVVFFVGYLQVVLRTLRGQAATAKDLFAGFPKIVPILLAYLLSALLALLVLAVALIPLLLVLIAWFSVSLLSNLASFEAFSELFSQGAADPNFVLYILLGILGFILFLAPTAIVSLGLMFWPLRLLDGENGVFESLRQSWDLTRGHKRHLALLFLFFIPLNLLGLLFLFVGVFLTIPLSVVSLVAFYERLQTPER